MEGLTSRALAKTFQRLGSRPGLPQRTIAPLSRKAGRPRTFQFQQRPKPYADVGRTVQTRRRLNSASFGEARQYLKDRPIFTGFGILTLCALLGGMYALYQHNKVNIVGPFQTFPEPVATKLRRAIYYSKYNPSPKDAVKNYREALMVAAQLDMDPYSNEVIGIKAHFADYLEQLGQIKQALALWQATRDMCQRWIDENRDSAENQVHSRKLLKKVIAMSTKIGELYDHPTLEISGMASKNIDMAVGATVAARSRQETEQVEKDEGTWVTDEEAGATFQAAADHYTAANRPDLSAPLYLRAIELCPKTDCTIVYLMNGLAVAFSQSEPQLQPGAPIADRAALFDSARSWANKALEVAAEIKPPDRNEKCDVGCAIVIQNLASMAEQQGNMMEARRKYEEAKSLSKALSFEEGLEAANSSLARLDEARLSIKNT